MKGSFLVPARTLGEAGHFLQVCGLKLLSLLCQVISVGSEAQLGFDAFQLRTKLYPLAADVANVVAMAAVWAGKVPLFAPTGGPLGDDGRCKSV